MRYADMFARVRERGEKALVAFAMLDDPNREDSLEIIDILLSSGADALELGIGFSDPVIDGLGLQRSHARARAQGAVIPRAVAEARQIRERYPEVPLAIFTYANLVGCYGPEKFMTDFAGAGIDTVIIADLPTRESTAWNQIARQAGISLTFIAPFSATEETLRDIAANSPDCVYAMINPPRAQLPELQTLRKCNSAPVLMAFGVDTPAQGAAAVRSGADGVVVGPVLMETVEKNLRQQGESYLIADKSVLRTQLGNQVAEFKKAINQA